mmetsp:Transcript_22740/g.72769  ORF Transcript_22740/g.72769 Transcript_22740/m.72769 type:complete len:262 (+) Transcript_22740:214-999(+)
MMPPLPCVAITFSVKPSSVPFGRMHSSVRRPKRPVFGVSNVLMRFALSLYVMSATSMPSSLYAFMVSAKTVLVKSACSFSLAKLMHSCSIEFFSKISKPKMSTIPMTFLMVALRSQPLASAIDVLICSISLSKSREKMPLAIASRVSTALAKVRSLSIISVPTFIFILVSTFGSTPPGRPSTASTFSTHLVESAVMVAVSVFAGSKLMLPVWRQAATSAHSSVSPSAVQPPALSASSSSSQSILSVRLPPGSPVCAPLLLR